MVKLWKREGLEGVESPSKTMGIREKNYLISNIQNFLIKKYDLNTPNQLDDIKSQLLGNKILIINAQEILANHSITIEELKESIEEIKIFLGEHGGSIGRIGENYLILTPNSQVRISN